MRVTAALMYLLLVGTSGCANSDAIDDGPVIYAPQEPRESGYFRTGTASSRTIDLQATQAARAQYRADREEQQARTEYMRALTRKMNSGE